MEFEDVDSLRNALQSTKVTSRKQACSELFEIVSEKKINLETTEQWNLMYNAIKECMLKDNEKLIKEQTKKDLPFHSLRLPQSADLFKVFLRNNLKRQSVATCTNVFNFLLDSIADTSKALFKLTFLKILSESLLSNKKFANSLKEPHWLKFYQTLKLLCEKDPSNCEQIQCLTLVLKEGTVYKFPLTSFQEQFPFIKQLCQSVDSKSPKPLQESILALMVMFCKKAAKDNRRSCCKLGEEIFQNLLNIYHDSSEETKTTLYDFFLFQINLHNPKGIHRKHVAAFAISESNWVVYLKGLYQILMYQLKSSLNLSSKDKSIFVFVNEKYYLHHTFLQLFVEICKQLFEDDDSEEPQPKRKKTELNVANLISNFQESKSWVWLIIIYKLIETYPQLFIKDDYITLLKTIAPLFSESKDEVLVSHIQKALIVLLKVQNETFENPLWKNVADTVSRILNQNDAQTHELFQLLIQKKHVINFELNFSTDGAPLYSHNLKTLEVAFAHFPFLQYDKSIKKGTIKWLIRKFPDCHSELAKLLLYLTLKDFPKVEHSTEVCQRPYEDIENLYLTVCFESLLTETKEHEEDAQFLCADQSLLDVLLEELYKILDFEGMIKTKNLFSMVTFAFQCLCLLYENDFIDEGNLPLAGIFKHRLGFIFDSCFTVGVPQDEKGKMLDLLKCISNLFSITCSQNVCEVREIIPENFIRDLFGILSFALSDENPSLFLLKKEAMKVLVAFCCVPGNQYLPIQEKALSALLRFKYNFDRLGDYDLVIVLLENLKLLSPSLLPDSSLLHVLNLVQQICESYYYCNETILQVLDFLYAIYPAVHTSSSDDAKNQFVVLLYPIFVKRHAYSANISIKLLQCIHLLYRSAPTKAFKWSNDHIIVKTTEFLKDNQQEIRFETIKVLADFFKQSSKIRSLTHFHIQEITFSKISEMSYLALEVEVKADDQIKLIDDIVSRSSSIIHTFVSIIVSSHNWIEESLFKLIKIACDKNLDLRQVQVAIERASQKLGFASGLCFLKKYLLGLINRWKSYSFDTFPFQLYNCNSKFELYKNYWDQIFHIFIENEENNLRKVASLFGKTVQELIKDVCPRLVSCCIAQEITDLTLENLKKNKIYQFLEKTQENFTENIEETILGLMEYVNDENDFRIFYGEFIIFPKSNIVLTVEDFKKAIMFIQGHFYEDTCLISHLLKKKPEKVHLILSQLNYNINKLQALEEKLRYFHLYSIFSLLCVSKLEHEPKMQSYLIRDLTHTLLHHIKNHKKQPELAKASCKLLKSVLQKLLPSLSEVVRNFFLVIVSRLKFVALEYCSVSDLCVQMLEFMIVGHQDLFQSEIQKLASVPNTSQFCQIYKVHFKLKYSERTVTLEDEITQFLEFCNNIENLDECKDSVSHLRTLLINKKQDLGALFKKLQKSMGSSEDCKNSVLHKLVYTLIKLCCSHDERMSLEAAKCLGEIGAADLATLILQPEKPIPDPKWTPFELLLTETLTLLLNYIVDADVAVSRVASVALFQVMSTKEGRKVCNLAGFTNYLVPFFGAELRSLNFVFNVDGDSFVDFVQDDNLWIPENGCHESWVTSLVCGLLRSCTNQDFFRSFLEVCALKVEFSEQILPILVYCILYLNNFVFTNVISSQIATFFEQHWLISVDGADKISITMNKAAVKCMLDVVHFVRLQKSVRRRDVKDLKLDYLKMAKAAHFCDAHFTALLYSELWCQEQVNSSPNDFALSTCTYSKLDLIYKKVEVKQRNTLQYILRQTYKSVGETDALLGCGTFHLLDPSTRVEHYKESNNWEQVTRHYEREVSIGRNLSLRPLVESLCNSNLYQLALFCPEERTSYECLWKLGQWESKYDACVEEDYDRCQFFALKAVHENEVMSIHKFLQDGRKCVLNEFKSANMESIQNFYDCFVKLQCLNEIEDVLSEPMNNLLSKWKLQDDVCRNYDYLEPIHVQRTVLLKEVSKYDGNSRFKDAIFDAMIDYSDYARIEGRTHVAARILNNLRFLEPSSDFVAKIQLEEAQLCLSIHDDVTAKCLLQHLCTNEEISPRLHAMALKMTGKWMVESSSENRETIIENYLKKSLKIMKNIRSSINDEKTMIDTFYQLAKFADREYQDIMTHIKSDIFQKKKQNMIKARQSVSKINVKKVTKDLQKAVTIRTKQSCIDEIEINNIETEKNNLLTLALKYYLLTLKHSDDHNMAIFRLFSLLLENRNNPIVESVLKEEFKKIPTYTFINILPQIVPHITGENDTFMTAVNSLIVACAKDHPYHTLPLILALALSNKDREYAESKSVVNDVRTQAAKRILSELKKDLKLGTLIKKMQEMSEALIELAYHSHDSSTKLPRKAKLREIRNFDDVLLPTVTIPINKGRDYGHIVGICHFGDSYQNVGGINAPKRITCLGTDGVVRSQLVKGQDDLRQDAVMQQVFTIMNDLLAVNKQTSNLRIRTYKIVPLSMRSGILEWVDNTMPIGEYLTGGSGNEGAHVKFRPGDATPSKCRVEFKSISSKPNEEKLKCFNKLCEKIKPVFHKFFETSFPQPTVWYEKRRSYVHSVATSSMCGYILGIGDRHVNNILIDKSTAEVIHIDFGIAFEQGRVLPTPETVPFRLTRDMVDGMGVAGVEGLFRRSCERTMEVLRANHQTIVTILEVLLYDPLYDWTVSNAEANKRQKDEHDDSVFDISLGGGTEASFKNVNETAERALMRLKSKLCGTENGKSATVEHQVRTLIQQAVDPSNLSKLFYGWQPFL